LIVGNLVLDREAAQRIILHSIPKNQIVKDPNLLSNSDVGDSKSGKPSSKKRPVDEVSNEQSSIKDALSGPTKKKFKKGKSSFEMK
jgi:hypothetical protein